MSRILIAQLTKNLKFYLINKNLMSRLVIFSFFPCPNYFFYKKRRTRMMIGDKTKELFKEVISGDVKVYIYEVKLMKIIIRKLLKSL